ncbi:DUF2505 domain-containing protein [Actinomyces vulturis]|uniref:DUF2505 domain-containing protein n=1 Tax=Actinomyces vulturis TaxID=1857645 RepID=UPI000835063B|nr:DUF2505 domain-containing protein [Actinomyces vulturis]
MKTQFSVTYPASLSDVQNMLSDKTYLLSRLPAEAHHQADVTVERTAAGWTSTLTVDAPKESMPAVAARFIKGIVTVTITEQWNVTDDSHAHGTVTVDVKGAPVKGSAQTTLTSAGKQTTAVADVDFSVNLPLVGKTVEKAVLSKIDSVTAYEERLAAQYLKSKSSIM